MPARLLTSLAELVRSMNCYYSNLIEGHNTHPIDIERALKRDYSKDGKKRDLQLEAKAHIGVQGWIDNGGLRGGEALTTHGIREFIAGFASCCRRICFGSRMSKWVSTSPSARAHFRVSCSASRKFYGRLGKAGSILSTAASHHRLLWMHPFLDRNGRVARLMSHALLLETLDTGAVWSVSRGLARNV